MIKDERLIFAGESLDSLLLIASSSLAVLFMAWGIGANDLANAMGTSVGSRALTVKKAVIYAAVLNFLGAILVGIHVTETIQKGIIDPNFFASNPELLIYGMLSAMLATAIWIAIATYFGLPISTTHSIVGAVTGFGIISTGIYNINWGILLKIAASWVISPVLGAIIAFLIFQLVQKAILGREKQRGAALKLSPFLIFLVFFVITLSIFYEGLKGLRLPLERALLVSFIIGGIGALSGYFLIEYYSHKYEFLHLEKIFAYLQVLTACNVAFAHGANDVANAVGPFAAIYNIVVTNEVSMRVGVEWWMLAFGGAGIAIGCLVGGMKVMETVGRKITEISPTNGFCAEFGTSITVLFFSKLGMPISTSHTIVGAVVGVGLARGVKALSLKVIRDIVISWLLTIPVAAAITIGIYFGIEHLLMFNFAAS
ncbi:MAG: inorganic phosphate transporter [Methanocellales archaeon]